MSTQNRVYSCIIIDSIIYFVHRNNCKPTFSHLCILLGNHGLFGGWGPMKRRRLLEEMVPLNLCSQLIASESLGSIIKMHIFNSMARNFDSVTMGCFLEVRVVGSCC